MTTIHGFELTTERYIPELNTQARVFRHVRTGAELISMENDDENKTFGINFATPAPDSTGLPHILEHCVLGGSRKYPLKEPFVELIKGSLNTFINAFTYPDKTCYPVASQNTQDFYNLIDVYLDAVFYPNITPEHLQQEGWHYELENIDDPLIYKGIVFNEMKGVYSSPEAVLGAAVQSALFPDTPYAFDYGGDPAHIPDLTYEDFRHFHATYYHPSNARIWFYGDDNPEERLRLIDQFISEFDKIDVPVNLPLQPKFSAPRRVNRSYSASEDDGKKGMITVNWLLPETTDEITWMAFTILNHVLVGTPASPLRRVLIESGLGEDLVGGGLGDYLRQMFYSVGLKGIALENADAVEKLILDTLAGLAQNGIDPEMVEAALNTLEFRLRERNTGRFPRGLLLMVEALSSWVHNADPLDRLAFEAPLNAVKANIAKGGFLEGLIRQHFLENTHRTTVVLQPDINLQAQQDAAEKARLAAARSAMTQEQLQALIETTRELKRRQETPDSPEALATIPTLTLNDLDKKNKLIPIEVSQKNGAQLLYHNLFTNGIAYLDIGLNLHTLPAADLPFAGLFGRVFLEMGTQTEDFVKLSQRIGRKTGGIQPSSLTSTLRTQDGTAAWLFLRGKSTMPQTGDLLDILHDVLLTGKLDNKERFRQIVLEEKAGMEARLVPIGSQIVNVRLTSRIHQAGWAAEQMGGISYLFFLRQLAEDIEKDWGQVLAKLENIRARLVSSSAMLCNVTLDGENWAKLAPRLDSLLAALPNSPLQTAAWTTSQTPDEGLAIPAKVNYVGKGANLYGLGYTLSGNIFPIKKYLDTTWLWDKVRVQGGAYGGFSTFDMHSGVFSYLSYRDPNLLGTLDNYDQSGKFLRELRLTPEEVTRAIIGAISDFDTYQLPDAKGFTSMTHHLIGYTPETRQTLRDEVLATKAADFNAFADVLDALRDRAHIVVMGSQEALENANSARSGLLSISKVL